MAAAPKAAAYVGAMIVISASDALLVTCGAACVVKLWSEPKWLRNAYKRVATHSCTTEPDLSIQVTQLTQFAWREVEFEKHGVFSRMHERLQRKFEHTSHVHKSHAL